MTALTNSTGSNETTEDGSHRLRKARLAGILFLLVGGVALYVNADHDKFFFDSGGYFIENPRTRDLTASFFAIFHAPLRPDERLSHFTFALNYALNEALGRDGFDVTGYLWTSALIHAINACLVWRLIQALLAFANVKHSTGIIPFLAAVLFLVHPIHGSSIAYIAQRRGLLASAFCLSAVLVFVSARARRLNLSEPLALSAKNRISAFIGPGIAIAVLAWLGLKSKSFALCLPLMLLIIEVAMRIQVGRRRLRDLMPILVLSVVILALLAAAFLISQGLLDLSSATIRPLGKAQTGGTWSHLLTESRVFVHYLGLLLLPLPRWLSIDHDFTISHSLRDHHAWLSLMFHAALVAVGMRAIGRRRITVGIGILWFYAALAPYALVPQTELKVEYKTYLPSVGLMLCLTHGAIGLWRISPRIIATSLATLVVILAAVTVSRNRVYQNELSLWTDAVAKAPERLRPRIGLGLALYNRGDLEGAAREYREAIRIAPNSPDGTISLAFVFEKQNQVDRALAMLLELGQRVTDFPTLLNNTGVLLSRKGRWQEAAQYHREALRIEEEYHEAHFNLANVLAELGQLEVALRHYDRAIELRPRFFEAIAGKARMLIKLGHIEQATTLLKRLEPSLQVDAAIRMGLANTLADAGLHVEAESHYRALISTGYEPAVTRTSLGTVLRAQGKLAEAIAEYEDALGLSPDYPAAWVNLGNARLMQKSFADAANCYRRVLDRDPAHVAARVGLGSVHFEQGRPDLALSEYTEAARSAPSAAHPRYLIGLCFERLGQGHQALACMDHALALDPRHAHASKKRRELSVHFAADPINFK